MKISKNILLIVLIVFTLTLISISSLAAEQWPTKPIIVIIPWPPAGDPSTIIATAMSPLLSEELGVPVKIINKGGGGGTIATNEVANSNPDGYTVGLVSIGPMITQPLRGVTPYKPEDLKPLGLVWSSPFTLAARYDAPYDNLKELAEYGKTHDLKLGHYGLGAVPTLIAMNVGKIGGFEWKETAFDNIDALLLTRGDVDVITCSTPSLMDYIETKQVKILAVLNPSHYECCPEIETVSEQEFGFDYMIWFGMFVPKDTPIEIAARLEEAWFKVMETPEIKDVIKNVGVVPCKMSSIEAKKQIETELNDFKVIMEEIGLIK